MRMSCRTLDGLTLLLSHLCGGFCYGQNSLSIHMEDPYLILEIEAIEKRQLILKHFRSVTFAGCTWFPGSGVPVLVRSDLPTYPGSWRCHGLLWSIKASKSRVLLPYLVVHLVVFFVSSVLKCVWYSLHCFTAYLLYCLTFSYKFVHRMHWSYV